MQSLRKSQESSRHNQRARGNEIIERANRARALSEPSYADISVSDSGRDIYSSDALAQVTAGQIFRFSNRGNGIVSFGLSLDGMYAYIRGEEELPGSQIDDPGDIVFHPGLNRLLVADRERGVVLVYTREGVLESTWIENAMHTIDEPDDLAVSEDYRVYVADTAQNRVIGFYRQPDPPRQRGDGGRQHSGPFPCPRALEIAGVCGESGNGQQQQQRCTVLSANRGECKLSIEINYKG